MTVRRVLAVLLAGAALLLPSTSWSHDRAAASSLTGTIVTVPGGIQVSLTNNGSDAFNYFWIRMVSSVHHTGATIDSGGGCGPGPDSNTVKCGVSYDGFKPGDTHVVLITTDGPYPANGGALLFTGPGTNGPLIPAGTATGPPAPPEQPCKCAALTARILPKSLVVRDQYPKPVMVPAHWAELQFRLHWTLRCSGGTSGCQAYLQPIAPKGPTYTTVFFVEDQKAASIEIACKGSCGKTVEGSEEVTVYSGNLEQHDRRALGSIPFVVRRVCPGVGKKLPPIRFTIAFNANGNIDLKRSKLH